MRINQLLIAFLLLSLQAFAQVDAQQVGYAGKVQFKNRSTTTGTIFIRFDRKAVLVKDEQTVKTYHLSQVSAVSLYDHLAGVERRFITLMDDEQGRSDYQLFEQVLPGEVSLLKAYRLCPVLNSESAATVCRADYYVVTAAGEMIKISNFRKQVPVIFGEESNVVRQYAQAHDFNYSDLNHQVNLIRYYNRYRSKQLAVAQNNR